MRDRQWKWVMENRQQRRVPAVQVGEVLKGLREVGLFRGAPSRSAMEEAVWEALGPGRAGHVRLGSVGGGKLVLFVDDPAYRYELQNYWYGAILEAVQGASPEAGVHELGFRLAGPDGGIPGGSRR